MIPVLAAVFALAAAAKGIRGRATAGEFAALGLPRPAALAVLVPLAEGGVVVALLTVPAWGAAAALALLSGFTLVLAPVVRSGRRVSCGCLGALDRRPVSVATVARNVVLMAAAALALAVPALRWPPVERSALGWWWSGLALVAVPAGLIAVVGFQLLSLRHTLGHLWSVTPTLPAGRTPGRNRR